jgi:hypothetical protein
MAATGKTADMIGTREYDFARRSQFSGSPAPEVSLPRETRHEPAKRLYERLFMRRRRDDQSNGYSRLRFCAVRLARWRGGRRVFQQRLDVGPIDVAPLRVRRRDDERTHVLGRPHDERAYVVGRPYDERAHVVGRSYEKRVQSKAIVEKPRAGWMDSALPWARSPALSARGRAMTLATRPLSVPPPRESAAERWGVALGYRAEAIVQTSRGRVW